MISISTASWRLILGIASALCAFCLIDMRRTLRMFSIAAALVGAITFGAMWHSSAQENEYQAKETIKDAQQDGHMRGIDLNVNALKEEMEKAQASGSASRSEALAHSNSQDAQMASNSNRIYELSERVGRIEAIGSTMFTIIGGLEVLGFIKKRKDDKE